MGATGYEVMFFNDDLINIDDYFEVAVTGQTGILATSKAEAFFMGDEISGGLGGEPSTDDHLHAATNMTAVCSIPVAGVGFTIYVFVNHEIVTGDFIVRWVWA